MTLEQLLAAVRQLDDRGLQQVAEVVLQRSHDTALAALSDRLSAREAAEHLSDEELSAEVRLVREERASRAQAGH
jgi:hypothetical protein